MNQHELTASLLDEGHIPVEQWTYVHIEANWNNLKSILILKPSFLIKFSL